MYRNIFYSSESESIKRCYFSSSGSRGGDDGWPPFIASILYAAMKNG